MARAGLSGGNEAMAALAIVLAVAAAGRLGILAHAGVLLPFSAVFFMGYRPLRDLGDARGWLARGAVALGALRLSTERNAGVALESRPTVPFARPPVLELCALGAQGRGPSTSLCAVPGEIVCVVGPTGSGKTTLLRVLLGLDRARGRVLLDGVDIAGAKAGPAFRPFAWVPQEAPLVTGSVVENVLLVGGDPAEARRALLLIGAAELAELPMSELVGPGGRPLSGGERRQIALCRALLSGLPILLLDEPTEGLDGAASAAVCEAIRRLRGERTVLVATHRRDVVAIADRVVHIGAEAAGLAAE